MNIRIPNLRQYIDWVSSSTFSTAGDGAVSHSEECAICGPENARNAHSRIHAAYASECMLIELCNMNGP